MWRSHPCRSRFLSWKTSLAESYSTACPEQRALRLWESLSCPMRWLFCRKSVTAKSKLARLLSSGFSKYDRSHDSSQCAIGYRQDKGSPLPQEETESANCRKAHELLL